MNKYLAIALSAVIALTPLTACNSSEEEHELTDAEKIEALADDSFYILHNGDYTPLYANSANYTVQTENSADEAHTLWYGEDFENVPTMYQGDKLVYKSNEVFDDTFTIERFEYVGYTIGVSHLQQTASGRYSYSTDVNDLDINSDSSASVLYDVNTETATIDKIAGVKLRSGNVSSGGCVLGLEQGKSYKCEVYAGTYLNEFTLVADSIALTSMEVYTTVDFEYLANNLVQVNLPSYFNSGYYLLNGFGLVRYVNGTSYTEDTNFNVPNIENSKAEEVLDSEDYIIPYSSTEEKEISIENDGKYTVTVELAEDESESEDAETEASVTLTSSNDYFVIYADDDNSNIYKRTVELTSGNYTLTISNLNDKHYKYSVEPSESDEIVVNSKSEDSKNEK